MPSGNGSSSLAMAPRPDVDGKATVPAAAAAKANGAKPKQPHRDQNGNVAPPEEDEDELLELSKLRCTSLQTEEVVEKSKEKKAREARRNRCADYPGLAFGSAMFGSDTMMKFNIIKNELHNIMKSQLRRVDGEVAALSTRIKALDDNLEKSEAFIKSATVALAEAVQLEVESRREEQAEEQEESAITQFDAQLKLLEGRLSQAKLLAAQVSSVDEEEDNNRIITKSVT